MNRNDLKWLIDLAVDKMMTDDCEYNISPTKESIYRLLTIVRSAGFDIAEFLWLRNVASKVQPDSVEYGTTD